MKKVIRLTESDLVRLVKRVVKESEENNSVEVAQEVVSQLSDDQISQLKKQINRMGPERFLSKFESAVDCLSQHSINEDEESDIENKYRFTSLGRNYKLNFIVNIHQVGNTYF